MMTVLMVFEHIVYLLHVIALLDAAALQAA
jgi:hypothetical protein